MFGIKRCLTVFMAAILSLPAASFGDEPIPIGAPPAPIMSVAVVGPNTRGYLPEGKEVDAIDGDLVIQSPHMTLVIAQPIEGRNANLTTNDVGGCLLDLTATENGSDQLTIFRPHGPGVAYRKWSVQIDGQEEPIEGNTGWGLVHAVNVTVATADDRYRATYSLKLGDRTLSIQTESPDQSPDAEFRLDGGSSRVGMSPEKPADWFWAEDAYWGQAYGIRAVSVDGDAAIAHAGRKIKVSDAGPMVAYEIAAGRTRLHAWSNLFPEAARGYLTVGASYLGRDGFDPRGGRRTGSANGSVLAFANTTISTQQGDDAIAIAKFRLQGNETMIVPVPTGPLSVEMASHGVESEAGRYHVTKGQTLAYRSTFLHRLSSVRLVVRDGAGWPVPAKVEIRKVSGDAEIDFGPDSAIDAVQDLVYIAAGERTVALPVGEYELIATHGPEFDRTVEKLEIPGPETTKSSRRPVQTYPGPKKSITKTLVVRRAFDTPGWISADFHSHSSPSGDNVSHQRGRVLNLVCEDIDFAPCTEHNRISSYQSHIDELGLGNHILSVSGIELTGNPLPLNHHNVFPLVHKPFTQNGGGPYVADNPDEQIERLYLWDDRSEKVIQQNHPDMGWLLRDRDGNSELDEGFARGVALLDCIEVHPVESVLELFPGAEAAKGEAARKWNRGRFLAWLQLLNQGRRLTGVVNTDAHYNHHGSGWLRNWIQVPHDEPSECDLEDIIEATKVGRVMMSNGPMIELVVVNEDGSESGLGDEVRVVGDTVRARVRVRCADWVHCDRVAVLVDGKPSDVFEAATTPDAFQDGPVVFEKTIDVKVDHDSTLMAICGSASKNLGDVYGSGNADRNFAAATNAIWLNTGDEKWEPSNDTLGVPLQGKLQ